MPSPVTAPETYSRVKAVVITTIIVSILGYIDYITGEISIDVLYILCLCAVTWYTSTLFGLLCVAELISAKVTADYYDKVKIGSHLYEWNTLNYLFIYIIICLLIGKVRKLLSQ